MNQLKKIGSFFNIPVVKHIMFWIVIFLYFFLTSDLKYFSGYPELIESRIIIIFVEIVAAYTFLLFLIPKYLAPKKNLKFILGSLMAIFLVFALFIFIHEFYFQPKLERLEGKTEKYESLKNFLNNVTSWRIFIGKSIKFMMPTVLLVIYKFYKDQQKLLQINEQKKTTELNTLKQQLNPHFLFNTLNNLYALTIKKSDQAPEVIAKLSEILDYMLYGCNDKYVWLSKELELIENYLALEKVRYGERVSIEFVQNVEKEIKIAPLILLTFIENAFKHGVSQELNKAFIRINISVKDDCVYFTIENSVAKNKVASEKKSIGISNVKKQLELLYQEDYNLEIEENKENFRVELKLCEK
ncbi:sensor histidine kinase [Aureivirga sp. CE67]|uniref:sensor histidine kinase n=1 Tax=Aureivirga sp. CE67 TaxID=1788983 RepID=UPI0018CA47A7|nr:histidine kinase [Aureivirga sp. CE67]